MRRALYVLIFLFFCQLHAQPGDAKLDARIARIVEIGRQLKNDPQNPSLRWQRTELMFRPGLSLRSGIENLQSQYGSDRNALRVFHALEFEAVSVLDDLDSLIGEAAQNGMRLRDVGGNRVYKANLYYKRGCLYLIKDKKELALRDFLAALGSQTDKQLYENVTLALAFYYCYLHNDPTVEDFDKAREYLNKIAPNFESGQIEMTDKRLSGSASFEFDYESDKLALFEHFRRHDLFFSYESNKFNSLVQWYNRLLENTKRKDHGKRLEKAKLALQQAQQCLSEVAAYQSRNKVYLPFELDPSD